MLVPNNNPQGYKEHVTLFIAFAFGEGVDIIYWQENMELYVSNIEVLYKYAMIGHLINAFTADLLLHMVIFWRAFAVNE